MWDHPSRGLSFQPTTPRRWCLGALKSLYPALIFPGQSWGGCLDPAEPNSRSLCVDTKLVKRSSAFEDLSATCACCWIGKQWYRSALRRSWSRSGRSSSHCRSSHFSGKTPSAWVSSNWTIWLSLYRLARCCSIRFTLLRPTKGIRTRLLFLFPWQTPCQKLFLSLFPREYKPS